MKKWISCILLVVMLGMAMMGAAGAETYEKPRFLAIGTAAAGAAFYPIGIAMADIITNNLGIQTTAQVTGGAIENLTLVQNNTVDLGITMGNSALEAYEGIGEGIEAPYTNINGLLGGLSKGYFQVVVLDSSPIQTMADLKGKKVAMGAPGNGGISVARDVWAEYGFGLDDINASYISYSDGISSLTDGNVDAVVVQAAAPTAAVQELAASSRAWRLIPIEEEIGQKLTEKYNYFGCDELGAGVYNTAAGTLSVYIKTMVIIRADLSEELVYDLTKTLFDNLSAIQESHPAAKGFNAEDAVLSPIPLHPGAERYYKEIGKIQ